MLGLVYAVVRWTTGVVVWCFRSKGRQAVEIAALHHQLDVLSRQVVRPRLDSKDRLVLASASRYLPRRRWGLFFVSPKTLLDWHRKLVGRQARVWGGKRGRPTIDQETAQLAIRLARENPRWGYQRIKGELARLGHQISTTSVCRILQRNGIGPAPRRGGPSWSEFLRQQAKSILACDFFTVSTFFGGTIYALFFIEPATRIVHYVGATARPKGDWAALNTHRMLVRLAARFRTICMLIHDRDSKFTKRFDDLFRSRDIEVRLTPVRAPRANAFAERWIATVRAECLDWLFILGPRHLDAVMREYVNHYNQARSHSSIDFRAPGESAGREVPQCPLAEVRRREHLGGLLHEYYRAA